MNNISKAICAVTILSCSLTIGCRNTKKSATEGNTMTAAITKGEISKSLRLVAPIRPDDAFEVYAEIEGKIREVHVSRGQLVRAGDLLVSIDATSAQRRLAENRIKENIAQVSLDEAIGESKGEYATARLRLKLELAKLHVKEGEDEVRQFEVRASRDGKVGFVAVKNGDRVAARNPFSKGTKLLDMAGADTYKLKPVVSEREVSSIAVHQAVHITMDAIPGVAIDGEITDIESAGEMGPNASSFPVTVQFKSINPKVKSGMTAAINIQLAEAKECLLAPVQAVKILNDHPFVTVVRPDGERIETPVVLGIDDGRSVQISGEIKEGQNVALF